ncbi:SDR family oxidoreductase [Burkholderia gladioli]|uniref:SDR family oxidoreductase n=1 Tax=Burkholderia gladioli TaxID=28095 RepID=UPI003F7A2119
MLAVRVLHVSRHRNGTTGSVMNRVLVTGGSGFLGAHAIVQLLREGYRVRATIRDPDRASMVRAMIAAGGAQNGEGLEFAVTDLMRDEGWAEAMRQCEYVLHIASPFPGGPPRDEDELVRPARDGSLRVLRAAREAGVKRVVLTSSFAAIGYGHGTREAIRTERDWTDLAGPDVTPYIRSKTLAERAAWDFIETEGGALELAVVNPVGIFGPVLGADYSSSIGLLKALLDGAMPAVPRLAFGVVDVRDAADLHLRAMRDPRANGQRFIAVSGPVLSLHEVAAILRRRLGAAAGSVPRHRLPDLAVRALGVVSPAMRAMAPQLGIVRRASGDKAREWLGWVPRPAQEALVASAESLIRFDLLKRRP